MTPSWNAITGPTAALQSTIAEIQRAVLEPIRTAWHCVDCPGGATSAANGSHSAAIRQLRGRCRGRPGPSAGPVASLPRDQGRPLSSVHRRRPRLCAASKQACERLPRQHETAAACGVSATNRQGGRVGLVYMDHTPPVWGCPGPAARPTSACSAEQRARPATAAAAATVFSRNGGHQRRHVGYWTRPAD